MSNVVLFKTHAWNDKIESFVKKIFSETLANKIDFFVLMHTDNDKIYENIKDNAIKNITLKFTENEIKNIYQKGFYNMWLSNHWILMWFFKNHKNYDYYWSLEYDVRIVGDSSIIWLYPGKEDFLYTRGNYNSPTNKYFNYYTGKNLIDADKRQGFLQIARYSKNFLEYLDKCFNDGENGQDELIIYSLLHRSNFSKSNIFLASIIKGIWTWEDKYAARNSMLYERLEKTIKHMPKNRVYILHPVK